MEGILRTLEPRAWVCTLAGNPSLSEAVAVAALGPPGLALPPPLQEPPLFCQRRPGAQRLDLEQPLHPHHVAADSRWLAWCPLTSLSLTPRTPHTKAQTSHSLGAVATSHTQKAESLSELSIPAAGSKDREVSQFAPTQRALCTLA